MQTLLHFDGVTFEPERDAQRLTSQLERVRDLMLDGKWRTLSVIAELTSGSESGISARLRDLRKPRFGSFKAERRYLHDGIFEYRVSKLKG